MDIKSKRASINSRSSTTTICTSMTFLLTWEKSDDEVRATFLVAQILRGLRQNNISSRIFDSGLGISLFRDQSTRTRFSFASACNLLVWRFRIWMKASPRSPMAKPCARPPI